jgi:hypothetical protein
VTTTSRQPKQQTAKGLNVINFVTAKPKLWWLMASMCVLGILVGIAGVGLVQLTGSRSIQLAFFVAILCLWLVAVAALFAYLSRQLSGHYRGMQPRKLQDQIW